MSLELETVQILNEDGTYHDVDIPDLKDDQLREMYEWMVFVRALDQRCLILQRQGRLGTYPPMSGQEAAQVGSVFALERTDWMFPSYRENGAVLVHGLPPELLLQFWMGHEEGTAAPEGVNIFPMAIPIATQIVHSVGAAWAAKLKGDPHVVITYFGDGATSEGDFHEAANFAGVFNVPVIFFCQNNFYAISVPFSRQTASKTIAQKAIAYGFPGVRVDGNDILAVYKVTKAAVERARRGEGPTLIEAVTYRYGPHTTADDPKRYRSDAELREWQTYRDPIVRFRQFLMSRNLWSDQDEHALQQQVSERISALVSKVESMPKPEPTRIFDFMYAEIPYHLREQKDELLKELQRRKGDQ